MSILVHHQRDMNFVIKALCVLLLALELRVPAQESGVYTTSAMSILDCSSWLGYQIAELSVVKPGITCATLRNVMKEASGFHDPSRNAYVFVSTNCPLIRIDVTFTGVDGGKWRSIPADEWVIKTVSKPYLESLPRD